MGCLISPEYLVLQRDLHARFDYGYGGDSEECAAFVKGYPGSTVLDYGCGQGLLGKLLTDFDLEEYDPCIDGKDEDPARADIVVCADVLEHIEPDKLGAVLLHLRALMKERGLFIIATNPSKKIMADGRSAHLIVEGAGFWFQKLTGLFNFERFEDRSHIGKGLLIVVTPRELPVGALLPITRIRSSTAVDNEERNENVKINSKAVASRLGIRAPAHDDVAHLACFGPSLIDTWPALALAKAMGENVFSVSGAHDFLIQRNIIPTAHLDCDPRPHKADMVTPDRRVRYWLASCVSPIYIEKLQDCDVSLWHSYNGPESKAAFQIDPGHEMVVGGGSIGLRAMSVLYCRGYRNFEIHGMDCSFKDGEHHAGSHLGTNHDAAPVLCGDKWFQANAVMLLYARYFHKQMAMMPKANIRLHGDGLLQHMIRENHNV